MTETIVVANQKGGVAKTTTAVNLAASLAQLGERVLLIDLDPQGNATSASGIERHELEQSVCELLLGESDFAATCITAESAGYDVLPANADLTAAEVALLQVEAGNQVLRQALAGMGREYGFMILDCPPSLNMLTVNALVAANWVLIPMQCEYYALEGLSALLETIEGVREQANPELAILGIVRTMFDPRAGLSRDVSRQLINYFGDRVFRTVIPRNIRLAEAPSHGLPIIAYDRAARGAVAYLALASELRGKLADANEHQKTQ